MNLSLLYNKHKLSRSDLNGCQIASKGKLDFLIRSVLSMFEYHYTQMSIMKLKLDFTLAVFVLILDWFF